MSKHSSTAPDGTLTGRALHWALAGLFLSMFTSMVSMNVVGTSMPVIIADIGGTQSSYTWVVMATSLASAISTPIWGKLADLTNKKVLIQSSLVIFTVGSVFAGLAQDPNWLIVCRVFQGLGVGGLGALAQIILAEVVSPRERGKYMGIMGAIMAIATVGGPLLGGTFTDTIGWRWNFYVCVPFAIASIIMLQFTLHLPALRKKVKIDYAGAAFISLGFSSILIWVTLAGTADAVKAGSASFEWASWQTAAMTIGGALALLIAVIIELKVEEPLIPLTLFKNPTFTLSILASIATGVAMFATVVFLGQYMQLARGRTVIESSLLTLPMMVGILGTSTVVGQLISRRGKWKSYMVVGSFLLLIGLYMLGKLAYDTSYWYVGISMFVLGAGVGLTMQNLVLVVQNTVNPHQMGAASSAVNFFRTIAGSAGMAVMGTLLSHSLTDKLADGMPKVMAAIEKLKASDPTQAAALGKDLQSLQGGALPHTSQLHEPLKTLIEASYGSAIADVFTAVIPVAILAIIAICFLPNIPLSKQTNAQRKQQGSDDGVAGSIEEQGENFMRAATGSIPIVDEDQADAMSSTTRNA